MFLLGARLAAARAPGTNPISRQAFGHGGVAVSGRPAFGLSGGRGVVSAASGFHPALLREASIRSRPQL